MDISIIGGDLRLIRLAEMYLKEEAKNKVFTFGLEQYFDTGKYDCLDNDYTEILHLCRNLEEAISSSNIIISSMPFSKDGVYVNAPYSNTKIEIAKLGELLNGKNFFAGGIPDSIKLNSNIKCIDLLKIEELTILNAIPTVEGAIKIAIEEREETIHESNVLVCGYGRIGKILCDRFRNLGADVYCSARKESDLAWIREKRCIPLKYNELCNYGKKFDIIINTVPTKILNKNELDSFKKDVLIIDLASRPGGIDEEYAKKLEIKVVIALGIPGKEQPRTAAKYIKNIINNYTSLLT